MAEHDLQSVAFPRLDESQISALVGCVAAPLVRYDAGRKLYEVGDRDYKVFVVRSGEVEIVDESGEAPKTIVVHKAGGFTGEEGQLTGRPAVATAVARADSEVYEVTADGLRQIVNRCPEVGDVILQAFIARRQLLRESGEYTGIRVIGSRYSHDTFRVRDFLARNRSLFTFLDLESHPEVDELLRRFGLTVRDTPVVAWGRKLVLRNPSNRELAEALGLRRPLEQTVYDLAIVGGGPGGLAASVYGASEGLSTVVLERTAPGGQAGASMRIENYLGFPTGVTGGELAERAIVQANKFGAILSVATPVVSLTFENAYSVLALEGGETVVAKCLLIATGAEYRKLDVDGCAQFEGSGVYYAATPNEVQLCKGENVMIVGGGNAAGQAAVYLSRYARKVYLLIRGNDLCKSMSAYLAHRIEQTPSIEVLLNTTVRRMSGNGNLASVEIVNNQTGETRTLETPAVFSFIGAIPHTDWLPPDIERDEKNFVRTGPSMAQSAHWTLRRQPFLLETSRPGVFAAGDVRSGSVKRVASAVGEGAMAVQFVHEYLKEM
jgi:thioredoxin reductase (NADPH)